MTRLRADLLLFITAMIWGASFIAQKTGNDLIGPIQFVGGRFLLSALLVAPMAVLESRQPSTRLQRGDFLFAGGIGAVVFAGTAVQQIGMLSTTVSNAGFVTTLYIAFVPLVAWVLTRTRVRPVVVAACGISLAGAWLLTNNKGAAGRLSVGDVLELIGAVLFALHIVLISKFLARVRRPYFLAFFQFAVAAVMGIAGAPAAESITWSGIINALPAVAYAGLLSGGIGFTLQIVAQRYTPATEAALIMSLESVFAAMWAAILLHERLPFLAMVGCGMILAGAVLVEVSPLLPGRRRLEAEETLAILPLGKVPLD